MGNSVWCKLSIFDWAAFIGLFLTEGHTESIPRNWCYRVGISQESDYNKVSEIQDLLDRLPFNFSKHNGHQWVVNNKELWTYLGQFGKSSNKFIPKELKNSSRTVLEELIKWMLMGDGHINNGGQNCFTTISEKLSDDFQEVILKIGKRTHIWKEYKENEKHHDVYHMAISSDKYTWWYHNGKRSVTKEIHNCKVSCLRVPNGIFMIRSINGKKPIWTGK